jgi:hypothetical protein
LTNDHVNAAAESLLTDRNEVLSQIWGDVSPESRADAVQLALRKEMAKSETSPARLAELTERGIVAEGGGNKLRVSSRLIERYAARQPVTLPDIRRLFGTPEVFAQSIQEVLEVRLAQIHGLDPALKNDLSTVIKNIGVMSSDNAVGCMRSIAHRCLQEILKADCHQGKVDPKWISEWKNASSETRFGPAPADQKIANGIVPQKRGHQLRLLELMMNEHCGRKSRIRYSTFKLLQAVFDYSNFGQHASELGQDDPFCGETVPGTFLSVACMAAIELCCQVKADVAPNKS